jgi:hypothetical protein
LVFAWVIELRQDRSEMKTTTRRAAEEEEGTESKSMSTILCTYSMYLVVVSVGALLVYDESAERWEQKGSW